MNNIKFIVFIILLVLSNLYLFANGIWFYQDASGWFKTFNEAQLNLFSNFAIFDNGYYYSYGINKGILAFNGFLYSVFAYFLLLVFESGLSQILLVLIGYIISFISFYLFSGIFIVDKNIRYTLSLIYVINPLVINLQGSVYLYSAVPLFIYSINLFYKKNNNYLRYLIVNLISFFLIVTYIRFIQTSVIVIVPYLIYMFLKDKYNLLSWKNLMLIIAYIFITLPLILSFVFQMQENSNVAFNYKQVLGESINMLPMIDAYNVIQSFNLPFYSNYYTRFTGILLFGFILYLMIRKKNRINNLYLINTLLVLFGITCYGLGNIFGNELYPLLLSFLPFLTNGPFWALYIVVIPLIMLLGQLTEKNKLYIYFFTSIFVFVTILPLLNLGSFELNKVKISDIPESYKSLYLSPSIVNKEPTYYILGSCWRARYMNDLNVPTLCINLQQNYPSITFKNPRHLSGMDYYISELLYANTNINNLRITHNLKNIIVPNDIVQKIGPGPETGAREIQLAKKLNNKLAANELLFESKNQNFSKYYFRNKDDYEFFIYSPREIIYRTKPEAILDNSLDLEKLPVVLSEKKLLKSKLQNANLFYKKPVILPTTYYVKADLSNTDLKFLIQLNQTFDSNWKLKFIDKSDFEQIKCENETMLYALTNNHVCNYEDSILAIINVNLLYKQLDHNVLHLRGNFLGNTWVIDPKKNKSIIDDNQVYMVIYYEKQVYYTLSIVISLISVILVLLFTIKQEIFSFINRKN